MMNATAQTVGIIMGLCKDCFAMGPNEMLLKSQRRFHFVIML